MSLIKLYILNDKGVLKWMEQPGVRIVKKERIGNSDVSTVFLGLDHNFRGEPPILWETMVFGGLLDQYQDRCSGSREQAEAMHEKICDKINDATNLERVIRML